MSSTTWSSNSMSNRNETNSKTLSIGMVDLQLPRGKKRSGIKFPKRTVNPDQATEIISESISSERTENSGRRGFFFLGNAGKFSGNRQMGRKLWICIFYEPGWNYRRLRKTRLPGCHAKNRRIGNIFACKYLIVIVPWSLGIPVKNFLNCLYITSKEHLEVGKQLWNYAIRLIHEQYQLSKSAEIL